MTENKLKSMAENNKFEELMNNKQELERLSKIKDISEVLDVLNKYGYNGTKQDLGRDLFEILQGLSEDDLQNISGGRILNKKHLAGLMGGLTMMGAMGLTTSAQVANQSNVKTKSETSFLNKVDKTVFGVGGGSLIVGGLFVEFLNLLFRKPKIEHTEKIVGTIENDPDFALTEQEQEIYEDTVRLSTMLLMYVKEYITTHRQMPNATLDIKDKTHTKILDLIGKIRTAWMNMYENDESTQLDRDQKNGAIQNKYTDLGFSRVKPVCVDTNALSRLFDGMPVKDSFMDDNCLPLIIKYCPAKLPLSIKLWNLDKQYRNDFEKLETQCKEESDVLLRK